MVRFGYALGAVALMIAVGAPWASGEDAMKALPGYVEFDMKALLDGAAPQVEVNLPKALLRIAAAAVAQEQPDLVEVLGSLELIRVQVYEMPDAPEGEGAAPVVPVAPGEISRGAAKLNEALVSLQQDSGWMQTVNVQEDGSSESVQCFMKTGENGNVQGLAVFVNDLPESLVFVNIAGDIEPELLGKVAAFATQGNLDLTQLGAMLQKEMAGAGVGRTVEASPQAPVTLDPLAEAAPIAAP